MNKAKRRAKTAPKRKDAPKRINGFLGERFMIKGQNEVERVQVAVIGDLAFKINRTRMGAKRCQFVDVSKLFATHASAIDAMKPTLAYVAKYDKTIVPVRMAIDDYGNKVSYTRSKVPNVVLGNVFATKQLALKHVARWCAADLREKRQHLRKLEREFDRAIERLDRETHKKAK